MEGLLENATREDINFDSNVEVQSLKDAVFKLTTRVYLLEDFISGKFGEVLGNSGYTKLAQTLIPRDQPKTVIQNELNCRKLRKRKRAKVHKSKSVKLKRSSAFSSSKNEGFLSESDCEAAHDNNDSTSSTRMHPNIVKKEMVNDCQNDLDASFDHNFLSFHDENNSDNTSGGECQNTSDGEDSAYIPDCTISDNASDEESTTRTVFSKKKSNSERDPLAEEVNAEREEGEPIRLIKTNRGKPMLIDNDNHMYTLHTHQKNGSMSWRCVKYWSIKCKGSVKTCEKNRIKPQRILHNHVADVAEVKTRILKLKLVSAAQNTTKSSSSIIESILAEETSLAVKNLLPTVASLKSNLRKIRSKSKKSSADTMIASLINPESLELE